ncbi:hypothetical protein CBS14141_000022 [Malassezia furfur]|nr:hypothetical protein CBS14141_000022 [Malassezia furfur]
MAQRPSGASGNRAANVSPAGTRHSTPLPGMSDTASMLRTRRAGGARPSQLEEIDDFEVETPGDAALNELPSGIIMPGVKGSRPKEAEQQPTEAPGRGNKTIKAPTTTRAPFPRAAPPKLPSSKTGAPGASSARCVSAGEQAVGGPAA